MKHVSELWARYESLEPLFTPTERYTLTFVPVILTGLYLAFVLKIGPQYMKDRKAYNLRAVTRIFNLIQVLCNVYFAYHIGKFVFHPKNSILCPSLLNQERAYALEQKRLSICYLGVRISDFIDTICFVLTKKTNHVSFLHVYHHVLVVLGFTFILLLGSGPTLTFAGLLNSSVHIVMYTYYFLSTFPSVAPYLWWKKYITRLQLAQFVIIICHTAVGLSRCHYPRSVTYFITANAMLLLILFSRFYLQTYTSDFKKREESLSEKYSHTH